MLDWLIKECEKNSDWRFCIYRSRNGLHVFVLHTIFDTCESRANFQLKLKCDFNYTLYTYMRKGCSVRLNAKEGESLPLYHFVGYLGQGKTISSLHNLVQLHEFLPNLFHNQGIAGIQ